MSETSAVEMSSSRDALLQRQKDAKLTELSDLPNEMLDKIISYIDEADDLQAVSRISKRFNAVAERHLYHTIKFTRSHTTVQVVRLVLNIIYRPDLARLIKRAKFRHFETVDYGSDPSFKELRELCTQLGQACNFHISGKRHTTSLRPEYWGYCLELSIKAVCFLMLMLLCVNMEFLECHARTYEYNKSFWQIIALCTDGSTLPMFSHLKELKASNLALRDAFELEIPSLEKLTVSMNKSESIMYRWGDFDAFIATAPNLASLEVDHLQVDGWQEEFRETLIALSPTLTDLKLSGEGGAFLDLRSFDKLTHLHTDLKFLVSAKSPDVDENLFKFWTLLPPNIEHLGIDTDKIFLRDVENDCLVSNSLSTYAQLLSMEATQSLKHVEICLWYCDAQWTDRLHRRNYPTQTDRRRYHAHILGLLSFRDTVTAAGISCELELYNDHGDFWNFNLVERYDPDPDYNSDEVDTDSAEAE